MEGARLVGIGRLRWRPWPGKGWGRTRGLPTVDLWPRMGGGAPAAGRPAVHREHGRGRLCSGELPAWDEPSATQGGCRGSRAAAKRVGLRRYWPEGAAPRWGAQQCRWHELRRVRGARWAVFYRQGAATGRQLQCRGTAAILPCVRTRLTTDRWTSQSGYDAVRRCGSCSKDGRREGDQQPWPRGGGERARTDAEVGAASWARRVVSGIHRGYSCKEGRRQTPTRIPSNSTRTRFV
jgi:hypothetical protein